MGSVAGLSAEGDEKNADTGTESSCGDLGEEVGRVALRKAFSRSRAPRQVALCSPKGGRCAVLRWEMTWCT